MVQNTPSEIGNTQSVSELQQARRVNLQHAKRVNSQHAKRVNLQHAKRVNLQHTSISTRQFGVRVLKT